jgi:hypothetical protein
VDGVRPAEQPAADLEKSRGWLGIAIGLILVGFVVSVVLCCGIVVGLIPAGDHPVAVQPEATPVAITGSAALLPDGVTVVYSDPAGACRGPALSVAESDERVVLALTETDAGLAGCVRSPDLRLPIEVQLEQPLGSRPLVDRVTGAVVPYFNMRRGLFMPGGLVNSVEFTPYSTPTTSAPYFGGPGAGVVVRTYLGRDADGHPSPLAWLELVQVTGSDGWHPPPSTVTTPVTVRGHAGRAAAGTIVWEESGLTIALTGAGPPPSGGAPYPLTGPPLPTDVLVSIAAALGEEPP